ncbi:hypothetical protein [Janibacter indicus]|uniref:Uncharacterized protein n=1 Tax=Janibacter indicus TaxID=857417 RepID=A0A1W1YRY3_9MICO|nr:hypothetical protein [Janibacter indicus]SMC38894.1 hypothetical protein SAMN06296429_102309 [Janibacter indicus]
MGGEALFWIFIVVFSLLMIAGFFLLERPRRSREVPTRLSVHTDPKDPRGRHQPAERVDPTETTNRL